MRYLSALIAALFIAAVDLHARLEDVEDKLKTKVTRKAKVRKLLDKLAEQLGRLRKRRRELRKKIRKQERDAKPHVVISESVACQSSRGGIKPVLIVLHSTESSNIEGNADLQGIVNYFDNPSTQASSHVVTDADGHSARCVPDSAKAWTQAYFNPWCLSIEQIGRASQSSWPEEQVREAARWLAKWSRDFGIPLVRGSVSGNSITRQGVVTHSQLGAAGGGHSDPGAGFPVDRCIEYAKAYK